MSESVRQLPEEPAPESVVARYGLLQRAGGILVPILTVVLAFLVGGIVILLTTGSVADTLETYREIFKGSGLSWFFDVGNNSIGIPFTDAHVWFPWDTNEAVSESAANLQQTLILWVPLVLTGLAVAFAFRCGLFNIGGQGQYLAGSIAAVLIATELPKAVALPSFVLIVVCVLGAMIAGAALAGIAGFLKGTVGAHEVITTIMLNWIVIWVGSYLFGVGGPFQTGASSALPSSEDISEKAALPVFWGDPFLQGLHIGFFIALAALVVYSLTLNRTTLGYEVRAVGHNPEGARYGGISVARNYFLAMAIAGLFAGLAGALDILGWQFRLDTTQLQGSQIGFIGIAVALLGRNHPLGVLVAALFFGALSYGGLVVNQRVPRELVEVLTALVILFAISARPLLERLARRIP